VSSTSSASVEERSTAEEWELFPTSKLGDTFIGSVPFDVLDNFWTKLEKKGWQRRWFSDQAMVSVLADFETLIYSYQRMSRALRMVMDASGTTSPCLQCLDWWMRIRKIANQASDQTLRHHAAVSMIERQETAASATDPGPLRIQPFIPPGVNKKWDALDLEMYVVWYCKHNHQATICTDPAVLQANGSPALLARKLKRQN